MSPEEWERVKSVFHDVLERPPDSRNNYLQLACDSDAQLRGEVERLLSQHERSRAFLEDPVLGAFASSWMSALAEREGFLRPGTQVGSFTVQNVIGEGGMGIVYRAINDETRCLVALKILRVEFGKLETAKRFQRETRLLARLNHRGIAKIFESGTFKDEHGSRPFYAMELVEGLTVRRYAEENNLSIQERLKLVASIAEAVHHAHEQGVVHRDLKPANIMVNLSGQPKVLDFGVARSLNPDVHATTLKTDAGKLIGTIAYMSPEQVTAVPDELDARSDIYAMGVVAYELLTGRLPYDLGNKPILEAIRIIGNDDPTPLSSINRLLRGEVETMLNKALEKDRTRRYRSSLDFATDIRRYLSHEPIVARRASTLYQFRRFAHRNRALVASAVLAFAALIAGIVGTTWQGLKAREQLRTATDVNRFLHDLLESPFYDKRGRDLTVLELFDSVPDELEARFPNKSQVKAPIYVAIGNTYQQVGLVDKAEEFLRKGYRYSLEAYGEEHDETLNAMSWLALLLERQGKLNEAEKLGRRTLQVHSRMTGPNHAFPIGTIVNLANTLRQQEKFVEAEQLLRGVITVQELAPTGRGTNLHYAYAILARVLVSTNRLVEAEGFARQACEGFDTMFGEMDWRTLYARSTRARVWWTQGRINDAETLARNVLALLRKKLGDKHPQTVSAFYEIATMLAARGVLNEAMVHTEEALSHADGLMRPDHWRLARLRALRGTCEFRLGMFKAAEEDLTAAYERLAKVLGDEHSETIAAFEQLANLLESNRNASHATDVSKNTIARDRGTTRSRP